MRKFRKLAAVLAIVVLMFSVFSVANAGKPTKPPPECEVVCIEMPPPIYVHCMIYCPF